MQPNVQKNVRAYRTVAGLVFLFVISFAFAYAGLPSFGKTTYTSDAPQATSTPAKPAVTHIPTPDAVKALYMTACVAGTPSLRQNLVALVDETELNSIVIDIKDYSGTLSFRPENPDLLHAWEASKCGAQDMKEFIESLHEKGIYVIGRITVFQDPHYTRLHPELAVQSAKYGAPWKDHKGLSFLDVGGRETWEYTVAIARESYDLGFDELNFDYIRYPSDGDMKDAVYALSESAKKSDMLEKFFAYLHGEMKKMGVVTSADLFGMTTTNTDDLNIGQVLEKALPYFDYIAPMVYPSHYPSGFIGLANPAANPYEVIKYSMDKAVLRTIATTTTIAAMGDTLLSTSTTPFIYAKKAFPKEKLRTWIQDFNLGATYTPEMVRAQFQATYDSGLTSWMLWNAANRYTRGALLPE